MKNEGSPFAEMSYQAQQDKWREWRSRQLDYKAAQPDAPTADAEEEKSITPPVQPPAPRHRQLDRVIGRHQAAVKKAGTFHQAEPK